MIAAARVALLASVVTIAATPVPISAQRAAAPPSNTQAATTARIVTAAKAVLASLDDAGRTKVQFPFDSPQRAKWSNLPSGIFERNGIKMGDLTPAQKDAVMNLLSVALSRDGYQKVREIMRGDEVLKTTDGGRGRGRGGPGGGLIFGEDLYYLAFLGAPSTTDPWMLQFGGHHLAINLTMAGSQATMAPSLPAAQPATYTFEGRTVRPLGRENDKAFALITSTPSIAIRPTTTGRRLPNARTVLVALSLVSLIGAPLSAHRRDEYLQAARLDMTLTRVTLELDLTPGIAVADSIIADLDRNRDGTLSTSERDAYATQVMSAIDLELGGRVLQPRVAAATFPDVDAFRRGDGTIRLEAAAELPQLPAGDRELFFRNRFRPDVGAYLANALAPQSDRVSVLAQHRDPDQRELTIDYVVRGEPAARLPWWVSGVVAGVALTTAFLLRPRMA